MKIVSVKPFFKDNLLCYALTFDNGLSGATTDAKHRGSTKFPGASLFAGVSLVFGGKFGLATMPLDWNPKVGDEVPLPPHWKV